MRRIRWRVKIGNLEGCVSGVPSDVCIINSHYNDTQQIQTVRIRRQENDTSTSKQRRASIAKTQSRNVVLTAHACFVKGEGHAIVTLWLGQATNSSMSTEVDDRATCDPLERCNCRASIECEIIVYSSTSGWYVLTEISTLGSRFVKITEKDKPFVSTEILNKHHRKILQVLRVLLFLPLNFLFLDLTA